MLPARPGRRETGTHARSPDRTRPCRAAARPAACRRPGLVPLLLRLHTHLLAWDAEYRVEVLKEKFGAARVHIVTDSGVSDSEMRSLLVLSGEEQPATVCEFCGAVGRRRRRADAPYGWTTAVCDPCQTAWSVTPS